MRRNKEGYCRPEKGFWEKAVRRGMLIKPGIVTVTAALLQRLGLQIRATDVSIRVQNGGTPAHGIGVIIHGR